MNEPVVGKVNTVAPLLPESGTNALEVPPVVKIPIAPELKFVLAAIIGVGEMDEVPGFCTVPPPQADSKEAMETRDRNPNFLLKALIIFSTLTVVRRIIQFVITLCI